MKQRIIALLLIVSLLASFTACGKSATESSDPLSDIPVPEVSETEDNSHLIGSVQAKKKTDGGTAGGNSGNGKNSGGNTAGGNGNTGSGSDNTAVGSSDFRQVKSGTVRILFLANKKTLPIIPMLFALMRSEGFDPIIGVAYNENASLSTHVNGLNSGYASYYKYSSANVDGSVSNGQSLNAIFGNEPWDYVVMTDTEASMNDINGCTKAINSLVSNRSAIKNSQVQFLFMDGWSSTSAGTSTLAGSAGKIQAATGVNRIPVSTAFVFATESSYSYDFNSTNTLVNEDGSTSKDGLLLTMATCYETITGYAISANLYQNPDLFPFAIKAVKEVGYTVAGNSNKPFAKVITGSASQDFENYTVGTVGVCGNKEVIGISNEVAHSGAKSLKVNAVNNSQMGRARFFIPMNDAYVSMESGKHYTVSFWIYFQGTDRMNAYIATIPTVTDINNTMDKSTHTMQGNELLKYPVTENGWTQIVYDIPSLNSTNGGNIHYMELGATTSSGSGAACVAYIDDINITVY